MKEEVEGSDDATPSNDVCFNNDDFIEYLTEINDATMYQWKYGEAWANIHSLERQTQICNSFSDEKFVWTLVDKVTDDDFEEIRTFKDKI